MKGKILLLVLMVSLMAINIGHIARADVYDSSTAVLNVSLANQDPDPAVAGEMLEMRFMAENMGSREANNIILELIPQYPFIAIPGEEYVRTINTLSAYQQGTDAIIIKYKVRVDKDAIKGTNQIGLRRSGGGSDLSLTNLYNIEVTGTEFAQIIYVDKAKLQPGNETPLKFTITNVGNSPLQNLVFSWNEEDGVILPVYSDNTKYIKSIDVGKSVELEYIVVADVNADQGLYQLDLNLKFEAQGGVSQELNTKAGIFVGGETDFDVTFSESSAGQTSLSVANTGNNPAMSVTVRIPNQPGFSVTGSMSSIVGNLDKGDYTIVSFQISQDMTGATDQSNPRQQPAGQYQRGNFSRESNLRVLIEYTDTTGLRHTLEKSVPIQFRSSDTTTATAGTYRQGLSAWALVYQIIAVAFVVVVVAVCYRKRKVLRKLLGRHPGKSKD